MRFLTFLFVGLTGSAFGASPHAAQTLRFTAVISQSLYATQAASTAEVELKSCRPIPAPPDEKVTIEIPIKKTPQYPLGEGSWSKEIDLKNLYFMRQIPFFIHASYREDGLFLIFRTSDLAPGSHGGSSEVFFKNPPENGRLSIPTHQVIHRKLSGGCLERITIELGGN